jgi:kinesin family protein 5
MDGYNATIFAYGQSGSGKTFSMLGPEEVTEVLVSQSNSLSPEVEALFGIVPRATFHIFDMIDEGKGKGTRYMVKVSYLEIYNESVNDILTVPVRHNLKIREFPNIGMCVIGMDERIVNCPENVFECISAGTVNKIVCSTGQNSRSSRSHTVFIITCEQWLIDGSSKVSKINLVDLAGSEKLSKTGAQGQALKEAQKINLSLTTLGRCIKALTGKPGEHVPFRESKLTLILKESLGGNSKTSLIVTGSMRKIHEDETISTLLFAERAKMVKTTARSNVKKSVEELELMIEQLKAEIVVLKEKLKKGGNVVLGDSEELQELRAKFQMLQTSSSKQIEELSDELERNKNQMSSDYFNERNLLLSRINELEDQILIYESRLAQSENLRIRTEQTTDQLRQENLELKLEIRGKDELIELVKFDLHEAESNQDLLKIQIEQHSLLEKESNEKILKTREELKESLKKNEELQSELEEMVVIMESLEKDKQDSAEIIEKLEKYSFDITLKLENFENAGNRPGDINSQENNEKLLEQLQKENEQLKAKLGIFNEDIQLSDLVSQITQLQQEKKIIKAELIRFKEVLAQNEEVYALKNEFLQVFSSLKDRISGLEKELQLESQKNGRLSQNLKNFEESREKLLKDLENSIRTRMQVTINSLNRKENDLQLLLAEKEKDLKALRSDSGEDSQKLKSELVSCQSKIAHLNSEIRSLIQDFDVKSSMFLKEKESWKQVMAEKSNESLNLKLEVSEKDSVINSLRKEISQLQQTAKVRSSQKINNEPTQRVLFRKRTEMLPSLNFKALYSDIDYISERTEEE